MSQEDTEEMKRQGISFVKPERPRPKPQEFKLQIPIIQEQPVQPVLPLMVKQPHDSSYVYSALQEKHTLAVLPTLNPKDKGIGRTVIIAGLLILTFFSGWGVAYEAQIAVTSHVPGICAPPAVIEKGGCYTIETSTDASGKTITSLVPSGTLRP